MKKTRWVDGTPTTEVTPVTIWYINTPGHQMVMVTNDLLPSLLCNVNQPSHWSWMTYCHLLCAMLISPPILRYSYFKIWPWISMVKVMCVVKSQGHIWPSKFKGQGHGQGQTHWSHSRPGVQSICLLFILWQSNHFWLRYSKFHIWPWKFKVKVMAKVKSDGHIWGLEFNRYVCFSCRDNRAIFGWDIANLISDLENSRSRSLRKSTKI